jgi:uncharacterized protein YwlG (UPF0340 family)
MSILQAFLASQGCQLDVFICHETERAFVMLHDEMLKYGLKTFMDVKSLETGGSIETM